MNRSHMLFTCKHCWHMATASAHSAMEATHSSKHCFHIPLKSTHLRTWQWNLHTWEHGNEIYTLENMAMKSTHCRTWQWNLHTWNIVMKSTHLRTRQWNLHTWEHGIEIYTLENMPMKSTHLRTCQWNRQNVAIKSTHQRKQGLCKAMKFTQVRKLYEIYILKQNVNNHMAIELLELQTTSWISMLLVILRNRIISLINIGIRTPEFYWSRKVDWT